MALLLRLALLLLQCAVATAIDGSAATSTGASRGACTLRPNTDAHEQYYHKQPAPSVAACCGACQADAKCAYAAWAPRGVSSPSSSLCFLKDAKTLTPRTMSNVTLIVVRQEPPNPHPGPAPPGPDPPPPVLPPPKYRVVLAEHSPVPALSFANARGAGNSACPLTFNPSYVEVAGENKIGGVIVRTDGCHATTGAMSFAPCNVTTGVCGDLNASYQIPKAHGIQDPRVIFK
eukprot:COSAG06_NODE_1145_length_10532_cov_16.966261_7_plen_232_part_00